MYHTHRIGVCDRWVCRCGSARCHTNHTHRGEPCLVVHSSTSFSFTPHPLPVHVARLCAAPMTAFPCIHSWGASCGSIAQSVLLMSAECTMLGILCHLGAPLEGQAGSAPMYVRSCETAHLCIAKLKLMCCMCLSAVRHYQWLHMSLVLRVCNWSDVPYAMMSAVGCACACSMRLVGEGHIKLIDDVCHNIAVKLGGGTVMVTD